MPIYTAGTTRVSLEQPDLATFQANGSVVLDSRRTRPLWFDGRFLAARDLEREQNYFLIREADLGQAGGFEGIHGLMVERSALRERNAERSGAITINAGYGITPAGELVAISSDLTVELSELPVENNASPQPGISTQKAQPAQSLTGLYVVALQPVEYNADPMTRYPLSVQGARGMHDGEIVAATAVSLVPYPNPTGSYKASMTRAALARQIFVTGSGAVLSDALLPLAVISLERGAIQWIDPYLVRRESSAALGGVGFGLNNPAAQQAYLKQYDMQLQSVVAAQQAGNLKANFAASGFFCALPPVGRFPLDGLDTNAFSQVFFPQEMDVRLSIVPEDELPALFEDGLSLPPFDLMLPASAFASMAVFALIPVPRADFAALKNSLPVTPLNPTLPQVLANRSPMQLLQLYKGAVSFTPVPPVSNNAWAAAIGNRKYGVFLRQSGDATFVTFTTPAATTTTTTTTTTSTTTSTTTTSTTTAKPTTTTTTSTTTPKPTSTTTTTTTTSTTTSTTTAKPTTTTTTTTTAKPTTTTTTTTPKPTTTTPRPVVTLPPPGTLRPPVVGGVLPT